MIARTLQTNLVIQVLTFLTSILVARVLGPTGRGELALVLLYPQLVANIALLGVDRSVAILGGRGELVNPASTVVKLVLMLSLPAALVGYLVIGWRVSDPHLSGLASLYLVYIPALHFFLLSVSLFNGSGDFIRFNWTRLGFYVINLLLNVAIWLGGPRVQPKIDWVLYGNLLAVYGALLLSICMLFAFKPIAAKPRTTQSTAWSAKGLGAVLALAAMFAIPTAIAQFNGSAYQILVEHQLGVKALGSFIVLLTYSRLLSPVGSAIGSHIFHLGISGGKRDIARIFRLSLIVYLSCILPLWLIAPWLIPAIFGKAFSVDASVVGVLLASTLFNMLADSMSEYLNGQSKVAADILGRLLYLAALAAMAVALAAPMGLLGIGIAMAAGDLLRCAFLVQQVRASSDLQPDRYWRLLRSDWDEVMQTTKLLLLGAMGRGKLG